MEDEDDLAGAAGGGGVAASADPADVAERRGDAAEDQFERGAADRAATRGDRREERRFSRVLRDRAILQQQVVELQERLAAEQAARAKDRAEGYGSELDRTEREVQAAVESGDAEAIARANRRVAEVAANRTAATLQANAAAEQAAEAKARRAAAARAEGEASGPTETTAAWLEANGWYGRDRAMTRQASALHAEAVEDEGLVPDTPEYWRHIETGLQARFPGKVKALYAREASGERPKPAAGAQDVEEEGGAVDPAAAARVPPRAASGAVPASRAAAAGSGGGGRQLVISAEAVALAKAMGITPQQYQARATALARQGRINAKTVQGA